VIINREEENKKTNTKLCENVIKKCISIKILLRKAGLDSQG